MLVNKVLISVAPPLGATGSLVQAKMVACQCDTIDGSIDM